jgi:hypothetical protein
MHQAVANEKAWPIVAGALSALDADVVIDVGRLLPNLAGGVRDVLARADALVVLCQPTLEAIVHLREALPGLAGELRGRSLLVVPAGAAQFSAADIGRTLRVEVLAPMPEDPGAAAALANRRSVKRLERTRLLRWADDTVRALGIDAISPVGSAVESNLPGVPEEQAGADPIGAFLPNDPLDIDQPEGTLDRTAMEGQLAGPGPASMGEAGR